jgi:hypothetical protein
MTTSRAPEKKMEYVVLLYIIDQDKVSRAELAKKFKKDEPARIDAALDLLRDEGVVVLDGDTVHPTRCVRYVYKLGLIGA